MWETASANEVRHENGKDAQASRYVDRDKNFDAYSELRILSNGVPVSRNKSQLMRGTELNLAYKSTAQSFPHRRSLKAAS